MKQLIKSKNAQFFRKLDCAKYRYLSNAASDVVHWTVDADGIGGESSGGDIKQDVTIRVFADGKRILEDELNFSLKASSVTVHGGGVYNTSGAPGPGGAGGGGAGAPGPSQGGAAGVNGTANTGGGGGGAGDVANGGTGGSGIVVVRGPSAVTFAVAPGTNSTSTHPGGDKIATFTVSGTLTVS